MKITKQRIAELRAEITRVRAFPHYTPDIRADELAELLDEMDKTRAAFGTFNYDNLPLSTIAGAVVEHETQLRAIWKARLALTEKALTKTEAKLTELGKMNAKLLDTVAVQSYDYTMLAALRQTSLKQVDDLNMTATRHIQERYAYENQLREVAAENNRLKANAAIRQPVAAINFAPLYEFASANSINYNQLCAVVQKACLLNSNDPSEFVHHFPV